MGQRELDLGVVEFDSLLSALAHCSLLCLHGSDGGRLASTVLGTCVATALCDSANPGQVLVLVVHVVLVLVGQMP